MISVIEETSTDVSRILTLKSPLEITHILYEGTMLADILFQDAQDEIRFELWWYVWQPSIRPHRHYGA